MSLEHLVASKRRLRALQQGLQPLKDAGFPVNQGAVAVEGKGVEVGQFHGYSSRVFQMESPVYSVPAASRTLIEGRSSSFHRAEQWRQQFLLPPPVHSEPQVISLPQVTENHRYGLGARAFPIVMSVPHRRAFTPPA